MRKTVVVLGGTGMLGAMVVEVLARDPRFAVVATTRRSFEPDDRPVTWRKLDALAATMEDCSCAIAGAEWVINCIGITKPLIADDDAAKVEQAIRINALFPHTLAAAAEASAIRVLQIATDCVFSGARGGYREDSPNDALDV